MQSPPNASSSLFETVQRKMGSSRISVSPSGEYARKAGDGDWQPALAITVPWNPHPEGIATVWDLRLFRDGSTIATSTSCVAGPTFSALPARERAKARAREIAVFASERIMIFTERDCRIRATDIALLARAVAL